MTFKLIIFLTACALFLVHGSEVNRREDAESFITMEAAKELRNKLTNAKHQDGKTSVEQHQQDDYDEILKEIILSVPKQEQQQHQQKQHEIFFEKKYFDYLPNEISDSDDVTSEDLSHELVKMLGEYISSDEQQHTEHMLNNDGVVRENSRRMKRDVKMQQDGAAERRSKRQMAESRNNFQQVLPQPQYQTGYNPWTPQNNPGMKFHPPGNFYLPPSPQRPSPTYLPAAPTNQPSFNVPLPPDNQKNDVDANNRVGGFEEESVYHIFDSRPIRPNMKSETNFFGGGNGGSSSSSNRRPAAPTAAPAPQPRPTRPSPNAIDGGFYRPNENVPEEELEIEYAPEVPPDQLTTRAPLTLPSKKPKNNRQKNSVTTTTTEKAIVAQNSYNALYSPPKNDNRKPKIPLPACVQAIVNCCSRYDEIVRLPCFESHNCNGAFFGQSACSRDIKQAAFKEVEKYSK